MGRGHWGNGTKDRRQLRNSLSLENLDKTEDPAEECEARTPLCGSEATANLKVK